jgi:hypothetical protein
MQADFPVYQVDRLPRSVDRKLFHIHGAIVPEGADQLAGFRIQADEPVAGRNIQDPLFLAVRPIGKAAARKLAGRGGSTRAFVFPVYP